ncbi:hypothetical protein MMC31_005156 [Peltigera leucophlebia]|nr:hypothetical protein [Peltigera leucophlebia]
MAPVRRRPKSAQRQRCSSAVSSGGDVQSTGRLHTVEDLDVMHMAHKIVDSTTRRRETRREAIRLEYLSLMKKAQTEITLRFGLSQKRISTGHIIRRERLIALLNRKASIESIMGKCVQRLEKACVATAQELLFTVNGRIMDLDVISGP